MTYVFTYNAKCLQGNDFLSKIILKNIFDNKEIHIHIVPI